jgi:hypothetical protein
MLTLLLLLPSCAAPQGDGTSLEALMRDLEQKTLVRRTSAAAVWSENAIPFLSGDANRLPALLAAAPEIQGPILTSLRKSLTRDDIADLAPKLIQILGKVMNPAGAEELFDLLPELPPNAQPVAVSAALARGPAVLYEAGLALTQSPDAALRQAAVQSLLLHGPKEDCARLAALLSATEGDRVQLNETLRALSLRELPDNFRLPASLMELKDNSFQRDLAQFFTFHPQDDAELFLIGGALDPARPKQERVVFLTAFEAGAKLFRWKEGEKTCEEFLKDVTRTETSEEIAWTLLRLGSKNAKRYLLQEIEQLARDNPNAWQTQLALARRQVEVGEHNDAFKGFKDVFETLAGTSFERALTAADFVWAARAAAGSRHQKEAGQWLESSGLNSVELGEYKALPEFVPYLDKQPFKRLFGLLD